jgi:CheY-like chemotaxis protein
MKESKIVLITEDETSLREALHEKLVNEGLIVFDAKNGEEGLEIALREHPDLILADILMPKMDGITMLKRIREDEWGRAVKFIILTNVTDIDEISTAVKLAEINNHESFEYLIKADIKMADVVDKVKGKLDMK